ncbi:hypothetical protein [Aureimonas phyllosphaerae]|uniref:Uncharacterized protein n=1 Tax=Aureimonas phyllosphaerae TaxID=1166078 RepID=A0A7W6BQS7_9HYPH|nr:hypothetical protein [Aureimonas phyllosphaerae]MBB3936338.1 hypothetical protein [Aureimonas phyllosphaerae]MBB3959937.1 hypothetical protein [Aureimonas phyllosphaerae]SFF48137.1 hypothetical protein SAMN05216566_11684 [Aureimonas phyllosphaerae]
MTNPSDDRARQQEAEAILRRVRQETEPQTGAAAESMARGLRRHFWAADADPAERMEVVGTRIGRLAGLVAVIGLAVGLAYQLSAL